MNRATISNLYKDCKITEIWDNIKNEKIGLTFEQEHPISISDNYHSMEELYNHRYALFAALVKCYDGYKTPMGCNVTCYKSKFHADGTMYPGWFIVMLVYPVGMLANERKQISYHLPLEWWDKFNIMELPRMWPWDGHTSEDVLKRLLEI